MEPYGTISVYAYTSDARIPVEGAAVTIQESLEPGAAVLARERTDRSGYILPVRVASPSYDQSQSPGNGPSYSTVAITITHPDYEEERISGVQVFPGTVTVQSFRMLPSNDYSQPSLDFETPPQSL